MDRRTFLKSGFGAGLAASLGGYSLFPSDVHARIPANLKVTKIKVIPLRPPTR